MKRDAYDNNSGGGPAKRYRRGDVEVRLLIPSKVAGSIIGKGGSKITSLRNAYNASITVPDCPGPERILSVSSDLDSILKIVTDVVPNMEENGSRVNNDELDLRMLIHQSQAGCVIGKAGSQIKELRDKTGSRIKIFSNTAPQSTDRIIQIVGKPDTCVEAIKEVVNLIKTAPIKGLEQNYDPHNYDDFYAEEYGGYGGQNIQGGGGGGGGPNRRAGPGGMGPPRGPPQRGGDRFNNRGPPPPRPGAFGPPPVMGTRNFSGPPQRSFGNDNGPRDNFGGGMNFGGRNDNFGGPRMGDGGFGGNRNNFSNGPPPQNNGGAPSVPPPVGGNGDFNPMTQVTIPKDLAGAIIGKGGSRIRKIRQESGAGITIDGPLPGAVDRIITITGDPQQIQMAQYLLQQSVHESNNGGRGDNY